MLTVVFMVTAPLFDTLFAGTTEKSQPLLRFPGLVGRKARQQNLARVALAVENIVVEIPPNAVNTG